MIENEAKLYVYVFVQALVYYCLMKVFHLQVYPRVSTMAPLSEQKYPSRGDHRGHRQREQDGPVQKHRGSCRFNQDKRTHVRSDQTRYSAITLLHDVNAAYFICDCFLNVFSSFILYALVAHVARNDRALSFSVFAYIYYLLFSY